MSGRTPSYYVTRGSGPWTFQQEVRSRRYAAAQRMQMAYRQRLGRKSAIRRQIFGKWYRAPWEKK